MDWLQKHYIDIFAIIGFFYLAARGIVALTPTPKDNAIVEQAGTWLKKIAKIFGLDFTQGINKK